MTNKREIRESLKASVMFNSDNDTYTVIDRNFDVDKIDDNLLVVCISRNTEEFSFGAVYNVEKHNSNNLILSFVGNNNVGSKMDFAAIVASKDLDSPYKLANDDLNLHHLYNYKDIRIGKSRILSWKVLKKGFEAIFKRPYSSENELEWNRGVQFGYRSALESNNKHYSSKDIIKFMNWLRDNSIETITNDHGEYMYVCTDKTKCKWLSSLQTESVTFSQVLKRFDYENCIKPCLYFINRSNEVVVETINN